jgi:hypothetical protein
MSKKCPQCGEEALLHLDANGRCNECTLFMEGLADIAEQAFSSTPYVDMAQHAWPNVVKALYPLIAKDVMAHVIKEAPEPFDQEGTT